MVAAVATVVVGCSIRQRQEPPRLTGSLLIVEPYTKDSERERERERERGRERERKKKERQRHRGRKRMREKKRE